MSSRIELAVASLRTAASNKALNAILDVIAAVQAFVRRVPYAPSAKVLT